MVPCKRLLFQQQQRHPRKRTKLQLKPLLKGNACRHCDSKDTGYAIVCKDGLFISGEIVQGIKIHAVSLRQVRAQSNIGINEQAISLSTNLANHGHFKRPAKM